MQWYDLILRVGMEVAQNTKYSLQGYVEIILPQSDAQQDAPPRRH